MLAMNNSRVVTDDDWIAGLQALTREQVYSMAQAMHLRLKGDSQGVLRNQDGFYLNPRVIDVHVNFLQRSTPYEYERLARLINSRTYFPNLVQLEIEAVFNRITFSSDFGKKTYLNAGTKGGSANYPGMANASLSVFRYASLKSKTVSQVSLMANGLTSAQWGERYQDLNMFLLATELSSYYMLELARRLRPGNLRQQS
jgi:hypothetical protein